MVQPWLVLQGLFATIQGIVGELATADWEAYKGVCKPRYCDVNPPSAEGYSDFRLLTQERLRLLVLCKLACGPSETCRNQSAVTACCVSRARPNHQARGGPAVELSAGLQQGDVGAS